MLPKSSETQMKLKETCTIGLALSKFELLKICIPLQKFTDLYNPEFINYMEKVWLITLALKEQNHKIKSLFDQKKITSLQNINIPPWTAQYHYVNIDLASKEQCNLAQKKLESLLLLFFFVFTFNVSPNYSQISHTQEIITRIQNSLLIMTPLDTEKHLDSIEQLLKGLESLVDIQLCQNYAQCTPCLFFHIPPSSNNILPLPPAPVPVPVPCSSKWPLFVFLSDQVAFWSCSCPLWSLQGGSLVVTSLVAPHIVKSIIESENLSTGPPLQLLFHSHQRSYKRLKLLILLDLNVFNPRSPSLNPCFSSIEKRPEIKPPLHLITEIPAMGGSHVKDSLSLYIYIRGPFLELPGKSKNKSDTGKVLAYTQKFNSHACTIGWANTPLMSLYQHALKENVQLAQARKLKAFGMSNPPISPNSTSAPNAMELLAFQHGPHKRLSDAKQARQVQLNLCYDL
ncbi:uncharacterized protein VP01_4102g1, partial [Puccinia sorghi]